MGGGLGGHPVVLEDLRSLGTSAASHTPTLSFYGCFHWLLKAKSLKNKQRSKQINVRPASCLTWYDSLKRHLHPHILIQALVNVRVSLHYLTCFVNNSAAGFSHSCKLSCPSQDTHRHNIYFHTHNLGNLESLITL